MLVRFRQRLRLEGTDYAAGETADLSPQAAIALVRRGVAEIVEKARLRIPEQNRIRRPGQNRKRR